MTRFNAIMRASADRPASARPTVQASVRRLRRYAAEQVFGWEPPGRRVPSRGLMLGVSLLPISRDMGEPRPIRRYGAIDTSLRGRHRV